MVLSALRAGLRDASRHARLALVLWLASLLLAFPTTVAFFVWWSDLLQYQTGADVLLEGIDFGVLNDMVEDDGASLWRVLAGALVATSLLGLVSNAFLAGGVLDVLVAARAERLAGLPRPVRAFARRFFGAAGHFFWRSLALLVLTLIAAVIVVAAASALLRLGLQPLDDSRSIAVNWFALLAPLLVAGALMAFFCVFVLDYARIDLVRADRRNPVRSWWLGLTMAVGRFPATFGIWMVVGILLALLAVAYIALRGVIGQHTTGLVLAAFLVQQATVLAGAWLRVVGVGAEVEVSCLARPDGPAGPRADRETLDAVPVISVEP